MIDNGKMIIRGKEYGEGPGYRCFEASLGSLSKRSFFPHAELTRKTFCVLQKDGSS
jgi:hypothetical protein